MTFRELAALPDPVNELLEEWTRPNGLQIRKVRVPFGVVGIVYDSRPNVTVDAATLCMKTGNAVALRGGKEAAITNQLLSELMAGAPGVPEGSIALLDSSSRDSVQELIRASGEPGTFVPGTGIDRILVLITDGQVGNEDAILKRLGKRAQGIRIFTLGIDRAVNAAFLRRLADIGGGSSEVVESEERLDEVMDQPEMLQQPAVQDGPEPIHVQHIDRRTLKLLD